MNLREHGRIHTALLTPNKVIMNNTAPRSRMRSCVIYILTLQFSNCGGSAAAHA